MIPIGSLDHGGADHCPRPAIIEVVFQLASRAEPDLMRPRRSRTTRVGADHEAGGTNRFRAHPCRDGVSLRINGIGNLEVLTRALEVNGRGFPQVGRDVGGKSGADRDRFHPAARAVEQRGVE